MDKRGLSEPILLELVKHAVDAIVDEMAIALVRTAYSNNLKNSMDMSCALCDARGRFIAQGMTLPLHLGSIPDAMGCITRKFGMSVRPRDVFILNDPYEGGTHLPDFYIVKPVWARGCANRLGGDDRASARCRRHDTRRQWLRCYRDFPGRAAHSTDTPL